MSVVKMTRGQVASRVPCRRCGQTTSWRSERPFLDQMDRGVLVSLVCWPCLTVGEREEATWWERLRSDFGAALGLTSPRRVSVRAQALA